MYKHVYILIVVLDFIGVFIDMEKYIFKPLVGKMSSYELYLHDIEVLSDKSPKLMLESGFLPNTTDTEGVLSWYPARSVRIVVDEFVPTKTQKKLLRNGLSYDVRAMSSEELLPIFIKYIEIKGYANSESNDEYFEKIKCSQAIHFYYDNKVIGFTSIILYGDAMLSFQFATDNYSKLSVGTYSQLIEIELAKEYKLKHLYIGAGYESCCKYKSSFSGFEFWDGTEWSNNKDEYLSLCIIDDTTTTLDELSEISNATQTGSV